MQGASEFLLIIQLHSWFASYTGADDYLHQLLQHFKQFSCALSGFLCSLYEFRIEAFDVTDPAVLVILHRCTSPSFSSPRLGA